MRLQHAATADGTGFGGQLLQYHGRAPTSIRRLRWPTAAVLEQCVVIIRFNAALCLCMCILS